MPNIAALLKAEISRVARKEAKSETQALKKASSQYRSDIAALKRRIATLEQQVKKMGKPSRSEGVAAAGSPEKALRFSAKGLATHRQKLGLSAADAGLLLDASGQSVYKWEAGKARPRAGQLQAIANFRALGKKEAAKRLEELAA
jgi:DNA-binding transcriptional regulator YiaG